MTTGEVSAGDDLELFEQLARSRRSVRHFRPDPIPQELLERVLDAARWAPSGYNLQPTHMVVVTRQDLKEKLFVACFNQPQVKEAPVVVVFTGDRNVAANNLDRVIQCEYQDGAMTAAYERLLRRFVAFSFDCGTLGMRWLWKALVPPVLSPFRPVPELPAIHKRYWLAKQVMLPAMVFMLAAHAAGLATVPMEGFDEARVRRILHIPRSHVIPVVIPIGYSAIDELKKSRLPLESMTHFNGW